MKYTRTERINIIDYCNRESDLKINGTMIEKLIKRGTINYLEVLLPLKTSNLEIKSWTMYNKSRKSIY